MSEEWTHLDRSFARAVTRLAGTEDPWVFHAAAMASHAPGQGDSAAMLTAEGGPDVATWSASLLALPSLCRRSDGVGRTPLVLDGDRLYLERYWDYERRVADAVNSRAVNVPSGVDLSDVLELLFDGPHDAVPRRAAEVGLNHRLAVVVGGPGTGKTASVVKLLALYNEEARRLGRGPPKVCLMAPTGKAAARLSESIRDALPAWIPEPYRRNVVSTATTLHTGLGTIWDTPRFKRNATNPLDADVVVVDEASMVDLPMMAKILDAVHPEARLVLLGDSDQLRSIELGAVLGDLCRATGPVAECVVRLTHTWRYPKGSGVQRLADAILAGDDDAAIQALTDCDDLVWTQPVNRPSAMRRIKTVVERRYRGLSACDHPSEALDLLKTFRLVCAHRQGLLAVDELNARSVDWLLSLGALKVDGPWPHGQPVMITENHKMLELNNGDVGVVWTTPEGERRVFFAAAGEEPRSVAASILPAHDKVYATTVHKGQGSEYDDVMLVLPMSPSPLCTRELLYTAVTRAKRTVEVVGTEEVVRAAVLRKVERVSGLVERLR